MGSSVFSNLVPDKLIDSTLSCRSVNDTAYQYKIIFSYLLPCHLYDANLPGRLEFSEWKNQQAPHTVFLWSYSKDAYDVYSMGRKIVAHSPAPSKCSKTAMPKTRSTHTIKERKWSKRSADMHPPYALNEVPTSTTSHFLSAKPSNKNIRA